MNDMQKEEEVSSPKEKKTTRKTTRKTTTKSVANKVKIKELNCSGSEIAYVIGVTTAAITQMEQTNTIHRNEDGTFNLVDAVSSYCRALRDRKKESNKSEIELETAQYKLLNLKIKNRDWRMQRDRLIATEVLKALTEAVGGLREKAKMNPALCEEFDHVLSQIGRIDVDSISLLVEGDEEEEDE